MRSPLRQCPTLWLALGERFITFSRFSKSSLILTRFRTTARVDISFLKDAGKSRPASAYQEDTGGNLPVAVPAELP